jgi:flagellar protein FliO/FliZ
MKGSRLAVAMALLVVAGSALAQSAPPVQPMPAASPLTGLAQGLVGLAIVVGLIFAAGWFLKKIGPRGGTTGAVRVVGGASVGPRERVVVVRFGEQTLLLGVASGHVSLLHAALPGETLEAPASGGVPAPSFIERLRAARSRT